MWGLGFIRIVLIVILVIRARIKSNFVRIVSGSAFWDLDFGLRLWSVSRKYRDIGTSVWGLGLPKKDGFNFCISEAPIVGII